jgi:hypothetical protein
VKKSSPVLEPERSVQSSESSTIEPHHEMFQSSFNVTLPYIPWCIKSPFHEVSTVKTLFLLYIPKYATCPMNKSRLRISLIYVLQIIIMRGVPKGVVHSFITLTQMYEATRSNGHTLYFPT